MTSSLNHRTSPARPLGEDLLLTEHRITVPRDHGNPEAGTLEIFAREYSRPERGNNDAAAPSAEPAPPAQPKPWLLYLQGGPGGAGTRYPSHSGWLAEATKHCRVLMLDQRGTGMSSPVNRNTISGTADEVADTLALLRADSIVKDAELLRQAVGADQWYTHGQSYGGFLTATYLSLAPESLAGCMITGGLPPLTVPVDEVYRRTYQAVDRRLDEFFSWYPEDREHLAAIYERVRTADERIDGHRLRPGHIQRLGMMLGGNTRVHNLHYLLSEAFERRADGELGLTDAFKRAVWSQFSAESGPLYTVLHETIYAETSPTSWSAWRMAEEFPEFLETAASPKLTGEMIYPWHIAEDPATAVFAESADLLARRENFGPLYDRARLAENTVPVAACVYTDDIYVDRELSLSTAEAIRGTQVYERSDLHHDGIAQDGAEIFRQLARRIGLVPAQAESAEGHADSA